MDKQKELVERLAREAGYPVSLMTLAQMQVLERFAALVAGECAQIVQKEADSYGAWSALVPAIEGAAAAIRERFGI